MNVRPYQTADADELWEMKQSFETGLGAAGDDAKAAAYDEKLTVEYRTRWLGWVGRCVEENPQCVQLVEIETGEGATDSGSPGGRDTTRPLDTAGYVFVLPESMAFVWDAAVLNEIFVWPRYRGTDAADELMTAALDVMANQALPLDRVVLDVDRENDRARAFYDRYGFDHWGEMVARPLSPDEMNEGAENADAGRGDASE